MSVKHTILIVDDEWLLVETIAYNLEMVGFTTLKAYDGESGLLQAREARPRLVILDLMLPHLSGIEVCRTLRQDPQFGVETPILMMTARGEASVRARCLQAGANDLLRKPFAMQDLIGRVQALLQAS